MNAPPDLAEASHSALFTDLYQLTMLQAYHASQMQGIASFELFFRNLPSTRGFVMSAGLEPALDWLETIRFRGHELAWLSASGRFQPSFIEHLRDWRFTGEVHAVPEGTMVFPGEPVLRVTAPIDQAQFVESRLLNLIHAHSVMASKAARCVLAASPSKLMEFGLRRAHGAEAAMIASRSAMLAGFDASANVLAGMRDGITLSGTMAHSFVLAHEAETLAFIDFGRANPDNVVFLIDTWDTEQGAYRAVAAAEELAREAITLQAVRIDSGDLNTDSRRVRSILDSAGLSRVRILVSGDLDEWRIAELRAAGAPIDAYCVGTALSTSADAPALDFAYKLVEYQGQPRGKRSTGKVTIPGRKQVWRHYSPAGKIDQDLITTADERLPAADDSRWRALLVPVMQQGVRLRPAPSLHCMRDYAAAELQSLPDSLRNLETAPAFPVRLSERLRQLAGVDRLTEAMRPTRTIYCSEDASGRSSRPAPTSARDSLSLIARQASLAGGRSTTIRCTPAPSSSRSRT
jgi:nicotinate phosphoribosyltransferase